MEVEQKQCNMHTKVYKWVIVFYAMIVELVGFQMDNILPQIGFRQADDLGYIIRHTKNSILKQEINAYKFILWGRSMGAVTALRYMEKSSNCSQILCLVLDSPFINLKQVICQVGKKKAGIPHIFVDIAIKYIDPILKQRIGLVVQDLDFQKSIKCLRCPMILLASKNDGLIPQDHFVKIYDLHQGKKTVYYLDQVHTDCRHQSTVQKVFKSLLKYTNINDFKHNDDQKLMTYRSEFTTRRKSVSGKKLTVASKDIVTCRSNSSAKRKNIVTLKIMQQTQKQNKKSISLVSSRKMQTNQSPFVSQFRIQKKREIKILNLRNFIDKKSTLKIY